MDDGAVPGPSSPPKRDEKEVPRKKEIPVAVAAQKVVSSDKSANGRHAKKKREGEKVKKKKKSDPAAKPVCKSDDSQNEGRVDVRQCRLGLIIGHQIGSGSFAKVYKAYSFQKDKDVAVKIFKRSDIPENYFNKFIVREIEVIKELRHTNLVKFYDCQFTAKR